MLTQFRQAPLLLVLVVGICIFFSLTSKLRIKCCVDHEFRVCHMKFVFASYILALIDRPTNVSFWRQISRVSYDGNCEYDKNEDILV